MKEVVDKRLVDSGGAPRDRIVGFETEYALSAKDGGGATLTHGADALVRMAFRPLWNEYQESGERMYIDVGSHPENSTAEDTVFLSAAHRVLRGHVRIAELHKPAQQKVSDHPAYPYTISQMRLEANTSSPKGDAWGSHENMLASRKLTERDYVAALAIHHVSRIVWAGAGSVAPGKDDYRFTLSEKAPHIWDVANNQDTRSRPLVHLRDEPLSDGRLYRRIHTTCGDSVMSPFVNALRLASGSIVLRACELGVSFKDLKLHNYLDAIRKISLDPALKQKVSLVKGTKMSGLELQREIATRSINAATEAEYITEQEKYWAAKWLELLDDLEADPQLCANRLDWVVKQNLIDRELSSSQRARRHRGSSDVSIAWSKSIAYHRILPQEGQGLLLVRRGFFEGSPPQTVLANGLPLPQTRAMVRSAAIRRLRVYTAEKVAVDWDDMRPWEVRVDWLRLRDPYSTDLSVVDEYFDTMPEPDTETATA